MENKFVDRLIELLDEKVETLEHNISVLVSENFSLEHKIEELEENQITLMSIARVAFMQETDFTYIPSDEEIPDHFKSWLTDYSTCGKLPLIRAYRMLTGYGLVESKDYVEKLLSEYERNKE